MKLYSFKERSLGKTFARDKTNDLINLISQNSSLCILSLPGVGVTNFLRYFASTQKGYYFIFVDTFALAQLDKKHFFAQILIEIGVEPPEEEWEILEICQQELGKLANKEQVIIILNRFNQLRHLFDSQFFANLRWLQITNRDNITLIATSNQPLPTLSLFTTIYKFGFYKDEDLKKLHPGSTPENLRLAGGHGQLLQLLNKAEPEAATHDPFVKLQLQTILENISAEERRKILKNPFTPLLPSFVKNSKASNLPFREEKLFKLLKQNQGHIISKDMIFETVWEDQKEGATDWALNSLIYRLRRHPLMTTYTIESHKKSGYMLK